MNLDARRFSHAGSTRSPEEEMETKVKAVLNILAGKPTAYRMDLLGPIWAAPGVFVAECSIRQHPEAAANHEVHQREIMARAMHLLKVLLMEAEAARYSVTPTDP